MFSREELARGYRALGVEPGDTLMLHASVRAVGECAGGPDDIHAGLREAIGAGGTMMMYASCPWSYGLVGRGVLSLEQEREIEEKLPVFDPIATRADRHIGTLVEFFRTWPGTVVNDHVARFPVSGGKAGFIVSPQPWNYAFGKGSPLARFLECDGKILIVGSDHGAVTFLHHVEHVADFPGKRSVHYRVPVLSGGQKVWREIEEVDTAEGRCHPNWPERFFAQIIDGFLRETGNRGGRVGNAETYLLSAKELFKYAEAIMKSVASGGPGVIQPPPPSDGQRTNGRVAEPDPPSAEPVTRGLRAGRRLGRILRLLAGVSKE